MTPEEVASALHGHQLDSLLVAHMIRAEELDLIDPFLKPERLSGHDLLV